MGAVEQETNKTLCNTKNKLKARITTAFNNLNKETIVKASRRYQNRQEAVVEVNGDFFKRI